jgi:hypothetical protein
MKLLQRIFLIGFCTLLCATPALAGTLRAWLDRTQVGAGETVQLTLEAKGQGIGQPDFAPLRRDFDILGQSTGSRMTIINGQSDSSTTWTLELSPRHGGTLTIPALHAGSAQSAPLQLLVSAAPAPRAGDSDADIAIETETSTQQPYVQGEVIYTVRLLHAVPLKSGQLTEPSGDHLLVQRLGDDREYATTRNGRSYQVVERRYALFPQASGRLEIAAPVFDGEVPDRSRRHRSPFARFFGNDPFFAQDPFDDLMTATRRVRVRGTADTLSVRPRPAAAQGAQWLPATGMDLHGSWQPDRGAVHVGDPLTLQLDLQAQGLTGGQLPDLAPASVDGFDVYPDQAQRSTDAHDDGVTGHLTQKIAFIPRHAGSLSIPAIDVSWWDTAHDRAARVSVPARTLDVLPATGQGSAAPAAPAPQPAPSTASPAVPAPAPAPVRALPVPVHTGTPVRPVRWWPWISAALAVGWLLTLLLWWRRGRHRAPGVAATQVQEAALHANRARRAFHAACQAGDAAAARQHLLEWAAAHWPDDPPRGLQALAQRLPDAAQRTAVAALDRTLYASGGDWDGAVLAASLQHLPGAADGGTGRKVVLEPLYPETPRHAAR